MSVQSTRPSSHAVVEQRQTCVINQDFATLGNRPWFIDLSSYQVNFIPTHACLRSIIYINNAAGPANNGVFELWSSLTNQAITSTFVAIQGTPYAPHNTFSIKSFSRQIQFQLKAVGGPSFTNGVAPSGFLSFTLEFIG